MRIRAQSVARLSASTRSTSGCAFAIKMPRAVGFEFEQFAHLRSERPGKLGLGNSEAFEIFRRKIHAAHIEIGCGHRE